MGQKSLFTLHHNVQVVQGLSRYPVSMCQFTGSPGVQGQVQSIVCLTSLLLTNLLTVVAKVFQIH